MKRMRAAVVLLFLTLSAVGPLEARAAESKVLWEVVRLRADGKAERDENHQLQLSTDVHVGEHVALREGDQLLGGVQQYTLRLPNAGSVHLRRQKDGSDFLWTFYVPEAAAVGSRSAAAEQEYPVTPQPAGGSALPNGVPSSYVLALRVYPRQTPQVSEIYPATVERGGRLLVSGSGFLAPSGRVTLRIGEPGTPVPTEEVASDGSSFVARVPADTRLAGEQPAAVSVWGLDAKPSLDATESASRIVVRGHAQVWVPVGVALFGTAFVIWLIVALPLADLRKKLPASEQTNCLKAMLYEPENQTYSLSRAQFFLWTLVILFCYLFLQTARVMIEQRWAYVSLSGFTYTFLISLGTLVAASATSSAKGAKGAGEVHPAPSDLILHGGVLAPERVQQALWTVVAAGWLLVFTVMTYRSATSLPEIPADMLGLMGISSLGYLGGKLARKPGPVIEEVIVAQGTMLHGVAQHSVAAVVLKVYGQHLAAAAAVRVLLGGKDQRGKELEAIEIPKPGIRDLLLDPEHPNEFVKGLWIELPGRVVDWLGAPRKIILINLDGQRAVHELTPPMITEFIPTPAAPDGAFTVSIKGQRIASGARLDFVGLGRSAELTGARADWRADFSRGAPWRPVGEEIAITNPDGQATRYRWTASQTVPGGVLQPLAPDAGAAPSSAIAAQAVGLSPQLPAFQPPSQPLPPQSPQTPPRSGPAEPAAEIGFSRIDFGSTPAGGLLTARGQGIKTGAQMECLLPSKEIHFKQDPLDSNRWSAGVDAAQTWAGVPLTYRLTNPGEPPIERTLQITSAS